MKKARNILLVTLISFTALTACASPSINGKEEYKQSLTYSNLADASSQDEVRKAMESAGITAESMDSFFQSVNNFNNTIEKKRFSSGWI